MDLPTVPSAHYERGTRVPVSEIRMNTFPAYTSIGKEIGLGFARWKVYMALQPPVLDFFAPTSIKTSWVEDQANVGHRQATDALAWLVERGYLVEHGRDARGTRSLTMAFAIRQAA